VLGVTVPPSLLATDDDVIEEVGPFPFCGMDRKSRYSHWISPVGPMSEVEHPEDVAPHSATQAAELEHGPL